MSEEEKAIKFLQFCAEGFENDEKIENIDNPFLFAKAIIEKQQKEIEELKKQNYEIVKELKPRVQIDSTEYIERNFISKDKIRKKLEEVKNKREIEINIYHVSMLGSAIDTLQDLLEE